MADRSSVLIYASYVVGCRLRPRGSVSLLLATWEKKTDSAGYMRYEIQLITADDPNISRDSNTCTCYRKLINLCTTTLQTSLTKPTICYLHFRAIMEIKCVGQNEDVNTKLYHICSFFPLDDLTKNINPYYNLSGKK